MQGRFCTWKFFDQVVWGLSKRKVYERVLHNLWGRIQGLGFKASHLGHIGKKRLLFQFIKGLCKLLNAVYLFIKVYMSKKRLVYAVQ